MKIEESVNVLTIRETPGCLWLFGLFFAFVGGIFVYGSLGGFTNADEIPRYGIYLSFSMGAIAVATGFWIIYRAPLTKVTVDRETKTIVHQRRRLFGKSEKIYSFGNVEKFCLIEERDSEGDSIWSLGMELTNGETIKISSLESHFKQDKQDFVFQTNQFISKQISVCHTVFQLKDESEDKIS